MLLRAARNVLPDLVSNTVEAVKLTSSASVVALLQLLSSADIAHSETRRRSCSRPRFTARRCGRSCD